MDSGLLDVVEVTMDVSYIPRLERTSRVCGGVGLSTVADIVRIRTPLCNSAGIVPVLAFFVKCGHSA